MSSLIGNVPREKLKELIDKHGDALLQDPDRCEGLLKDHCGAFRKEISALVGALDERIPLELKSSWQTAMTPEAMRARLIQRLEENRGLAPDVAAWAVDAWSHALGVGLGRTSERVEEAVVDQNAHKGAAGGASVAERVASDKPGGTTKPPVLTPKKKGGIAAAAVLAVAVAAFAMFHHPTPPGPGPNNGGGGSSANGGQNGGNNGGNGGGQANGGGNGGGTAPGGDNGGNGKPEAGKVADGSGSGGNVPAGGNAKAGNGPGGSANGNKTVPADGSGHYGGAVAPPTAPAVLTLPVGTSFAVRLDQALNTDNLSEGELVAATVSSPVTLDGNVIVPTGAVAHLRVSSLTREGKNQQLRLTLADVSSPQGRIAVATEGHSFTGPDLKNDQLKRGGIGGAVGAAGGFVVGKLFHHGGAGAAAGAGAGAATGALTAKPGPVKLPAETMMHFSLTAPARTPR